MRVLRLFLIVLFLSALSACTSMPKLADNDLTLSERISQFNNSTCCETLSKSDSIPLQEEHVFSMAEKGKIIGNKSSSSYYKLFSLPNNNENKKWVLNTFLQFENDNQEPHLFVPDVYILDENLKPLRKSDFNIFQYRKRNPLMYPDPLFRVFVQIDQVDKKNERYMLITSASIPYGETLQYLGRSYTNSYTTMIGENVYVHNEPTKEKGFSFKTSPSGVLQLKKLDAFEQVTTSGPMVFK